MPTEPMPGFLDREGAVEGASDLIDLACPLLQEIINQATHVHRRCEQNASDEPDVDLPAFTLFRHIYEVSDGIEVLLSASCVQPAVPLLRSCFEASLELDYLTQARFRRRALSWVYCHTMERIRTIEGFDPETERGQAYREAWEEEVGDFPGLDDGDLGEPERLREFLEQDRFKEVADSYEEVQGGNAVPDWFQLFGGPAHREQLAEAVGRLAEYRTIYGLWSRYAHGRSFSQQIDAEASREVGMTMANSLRYAGRLQTTAIYAVHFLIGGFESMLGHYRAVGDMDAWYAREVEEAYRNLREVEVEEQAEFVVP